MYLNVSERTKEGISRYISPERIFLIAPNPHWTLRNHTIQLLNNNDNNNNNDKWNNPVMNYTTTLLMII